MLANNAGVPLGGPLAELTREEIDRTLDINLKGVIYGAQAIYPYLKQTAPGSCLLNTASAAALYGMANQSIYGATKAGVKSLTETLDAEWDPDGIKVRDPWGDVEAIICIPGGWQGVSDPRLGGGGAGY